MEKINFFAKWILRISIAGSLIYTILTGHWVGTASGALIIIATFLVDCINKRIYKINSIITTMVYIYCLFSLVMGTMWDFYDKLEWWDLLMHILSGLILGAIGNIILNKRTGERQIPKIVRFLFIIGIACLGGVIWEIYEFTIDSLFNLDTQLAKTDGISDTMWDLILDLSGGIGVGIIIAYLDKKK